MAKRAAGVGITCRFAIALLASGSGGAVLAQSATPGSTVQLEPIVVEGKKQTNNNRRPTHGAAKRSASTAHTASSAPVANDNATSIPVSSNGETSIPASSAERFNVLPGGAAIVPKDDYADSGDLTVSKALSNVPGVVVQDFFGGNDQPRIQIRGSGLQQNPVERGILVLQNGLPIDRADGSYIVGFADPQQAQAIEIYRGYMANRLGATVMGGALNFVSPTGSSEPGVRFSTSGGSFGQINTSGQTGFQQGNVDGLFQFDASHRDGFRDYNASDRVNVGGNVGVALSDNVKTRFFMGYTNLDFDVAGPLTKSAMYVNPQQVFTGPTVVPGGSINPGPDVARDEPSREASQFLVGSRTTATFGAHLFDVALGYTYTDDMFRFPISSGVQTTRGGDFTGLVRYAYNPAATLLPLFETTAQYTIGSADRGYYLNQGGQTGAQFGQNELSAQTLALFAGVNVPVWRQFTLSPAISYAYATRDNDDLYNLVTRPTIAYNPANPTMLLPNGAVPTQDTSYARTYSGWSPNVALSYRPDKLQALFIAGSRSFEPPTHDDLLEPANGTPNTSPGRPNPASPALAAEVFTTPDLKAQTATTVEGGWRGRADRFSWDAVTYFSWIDNELLSLRDATGAPIAAINADHTTHFGIELGAGMKLTERWSARLAYTYQDFRFVDDPVRGNNRLAGAPPHLVHAQLQFQATDAWMLQGAVRWSPAKMAVDNMNTLYADPFAVVDLRTEYKIDKNFRMFGEITNLFNKIYASSTLIVDQARPDQAAFLPGDGRAFYAGVKATF
jgi:iron complex outermembrane receptor protein